MAEQRKSADDLSLSEKKVRQCLESYLDFGFIEGQRSRRPECIFCGEKLANDSMKPTKLKHDTRRQNTRTLLVKVGIFFQRKKTMAQSKRSTDIGKAFEKVGSALC